MSGENNQAVAGEETDGDLLAQQAYAELEGKEPEAVVKKKPEESEAEPAKEQPEEEDSEPSKDEKPAEEEKEGEESEESEESKDQEIPAKEEKAETEEDQAKIQAHAEKHGVTYAEAKEDFEKAKAIVAKYKGDSIEMARALRSQQSEFDKLKSSKEKPESKPVVTRVLPKAVFKRDAQAFIESKEGLQEKLIQTYRKENPARTELMTDEAVLENIIDEKYQEYHQNATTQVEKNKTLAAAKKDELLSTIPKEDVKFLNDVKVILNQTPDHHVLSEAYDIKDLLWHAKGQRYDDDIKAAEARGFKRGQEQPKILGAKESGKNGASPKKAVGSSTLTDAQKAHALDMFPDSSEEKAIESFKEIYAEDLKKNSKFLPN